MKRRLRALSGLILLLSAASATLAQSTTRGAGLQFELSFSRNVYDRPFTGRVWVILTQRSRLEPRQTVDWFSSDPLFARDVSDWQPEQVLTFIPDNDLSYPVPIDQLPAGTYRAQAVMGCNRWSQHPIDAPGNPCSDVAALRFSADRLVTVRLVLDRKVPAPALQDSDELKYVKLRSELLSTFYGSDVFVEAAVGLPDAHRDEPHRRFATVYCIPGFDARLENLDPLPMVQMLSARGLAAVVVCLCASCPLGHHVFADSANNGPRGQSLVNEFIPWLETQFRLIRSSDARYLFGVSSGGWSSLWLQITYPDTFGGTWSLSPDPVDFTEFVNVNLYDPPESVFTEADGSPRVFARPGMFGRIYWSEIFRLEQVLGRGGQLGSCEAAFSPRGTDGRPRPLWDRKTGRIHQAVAQAWKKYDIRLILEQNWKNLGPKLAGKIHVYAGQQDEFFLGQACEKLRQTLQALGSDARVELVEQAGHAPPPQVLNRVADEIVAQFQRRYKNRQNPRRRNANKAVQIANA